MWIIRAWVCIVLILFALGIFSIAKVAFADTLQATITWKTVDTTRKIRLEKGPSTIGPFTFLAQLDVNTTSYVDATNAPGQKVCYRMAYYDQMAVDPFSTPKCKTFTTSASPPSSVVVK